MIRDLSRDHVVPVSRGGTDSWTNTVTACRSCNTRKGGRSPEQARMPLLYVPYVPNRHEHFILRNRRILADQMEYLLAGVPRTSRLHGLKDRAAAKPTGRSKPRGSHRPGALRRRSTGTRFQERGTPGAPAACSASR
mgnify:CR=1 FL=1